MFRLRWVQVVVPTVAWFIAGACLAGASSPSAGPVETPLDPPNVLIIITDDQPIGTLGVMPNTRSWFAEQGTKFPNAFANNPMCCPARAALMTGMYSHNNGVRSNEDAPKLETDSTMQHYLQDAGYYTGIYGKYLNRWHEDPPDFDRWGVITGPYKYSDTVWNVDGQDESVEGYWTDSLAERSVAFLEDVDSARETQPWMLYISTPAPHAPYIASPEYADAHVPRWRKDPSVPEQDKSDKPEYVQQSDASRRSGASVRAAQFRTLMSVDDLVGAVMDALTRLNEENTLAFFVSDNGYLWGHHGLLGAYVSKANPYSRAVQVPLMMRWPGHVLGGQVDPRLAGLVDVAPTVLSAAGVAPDSTYPQDGRPLMEADNRSFILNEFWRHSGAQVSTSPNWASLRTTEYNYVEYRAEGRIVFREYYDLASDPHELRNLLGDERSSNDPNVRRLHDRLARARRCSADSCP